MCVASADLLELLHRIFTLPKLDVKVQQTAVPTSYTPRKMATHPESKYFYTAEADHRILSPSAQQAKLSAIKASNIDQDVLQLPTEQFGYPRAEAGNWASCIGVYDATVAPEVREHLPLIGVTDKLIRLLFCNSHL